MHFLDISKVLCKFTFSCNPGRCPVMQERLNYHLSEHHSAVKKNSRDSSNHGKRTSSNKCNRHVTYNESVTSESPRKSRSTHRRKSCCGTTRTQFTQTNSNDADIFTRCKDIKEAYAERRKVKQKLCSNHSAQTDLSAAYFIPKPHRCEYSCTQTLNTFTLDHKFRSKDNTEQKDTINSYFTVNTYKELVEKEVLKWVKHLSVFLSYDNQRKLENENEIDALIDELIEIKHDANGENYDHNVKVLISECMNFLNWKPSVKRYINMFKENYIIDLFKNIKAINSKFYKHIENHSDTSLAINESKRIIEHEINIWLGDKFSNSNERDNLRNNLVDLLLNRLDYLIRVPRRTVSYELMLQEEIYETLIDLPAYFQRFDSRLNYISTLVDKLTRKLLCHQKRKMCPRQRNRIKRIYLQRSIKDDLKLDSDKQKMKYDADSVCSSYSWDGLEILSQSNIKDLVIYNQYNQLYYAGICNGQYFLLEDTILPNFNKTTEQKPSRDINPVQFYNQRLSCNMLVYTSEELINYPLTSTPKKPTIRKENIPKFNTGEISYRKKLADEIKEWLNTLPVQLDDSESAGYKEVIIDDLAGRILYEVKKHQLAPKESLPDDIIREISLWLSRHNIFDDSNAINTATQPLFLKIIGEIPVPSLIQSQHGTRKAMKAIQFQRKNNYDPHFDFIPEGIDIVEDEISMWMNEQPEKIYAQNDRLKRNERVHQLAEILKQHLVSKHSEKEIKVDVARWLHEMVKPEEKEYIDQMIEELKDRVYILPQEATLQEEYKNRLIRVAQQKLAKQNPQYNVTSSLCQDYNDPNETMKDFLEKFIEQNYDVDDVLARNAFTYILKKELVRINPPTRKEVYDNFAKSEPHALFAREKFVHELEYIKLISDWLIDKVPVTPPYDKIKNKHRIYFIHALAKYITELEEERTKAPNAMDYDNYLHGIISSYFLLLPITFYTLQEYENGQGLINDLFNNINSHRQVIQSIPDNPIVINPKDLVVFIDQFTREYGQNVINDPFKLEVWTDRLMKEIQMIARETTDPKLLSKTHVYNKLAEVPIPDVKAIELFNMKLTYVKEITDWLKNLPVKNILSKSEDDELIKMISELAEKLVYRREKKLGNPNDAKIDTNLVEFIQNWIIELPLEKQHEISVALVIQQLMNRIDRFNKNKEHKSQIISFQVPDKTNRIANKSISVKQPSKVIVNQKNPEVAMIEAIEKFCKTLPIPSNDENVVKATRDDVAKRLLYKISKLNIDLDIFNDELLFKEMFGDEVDLILENVLKGPELQSNKEKIRNNLVNTVVELENIIKEQSAGENYKQKLENTIHASIPNPVHTSQIYDPGFEFYKNRLATKFILENFDHADENVKLKYEKRIQEEINKYFEHAKNRNAIPLSKEQIQNELYSVLFKVPIPKQASIVGEVEGAKTRFEIDAWYEQLPLKSTNDLNELLERDKILSALARRIYEIESVGENVEQNVHKEITKWLIKLPLLPGNERNFSKFASQLQRKLKSTATERQCVLIDKLADKGKRSKQIFNKNTENSLQHINHADIVNVQLHASVHNQIPVVAQPPVADLILQAVEEWCSLLPLLTRNAAEMEKVRNIKDNIAIKIVLKISELNSYPEIFDNEYEYDAMLIQEIDKLIHNLPLICDYEDREARKSKLIEQIRSIKPLMKIEKEQYDYKKELELVVSSFLEEPESFDENKKDVPSKKIVEEIVDRFIEYHYKEDNIEQRNVHKVEVKNALEKHLSEMKYLGTKEINKDPLIILNELICKLSKVPSPSNDALRNIVAEVRLKKEVDNLFSQLSIPKDNQQKINLMDKIRLNLTKKLLDLVQNGYNSLNESDMKSLVYKYMIKLDKDVNPSVINDFVKRLGNNRAMRRAQAPIPDHLKDNSVMHQIATQHVITLPSDGRKANAVYPELGQAKVELNMRKNMPVLREGDYSSSEDSDAGKRCKCIRRCARGKRIYIARRHFNYYYTFRRPAVPMRCRFRRFGLYFY